MERSTCCRGHYGAIIVRNDEIIATGYNGAPRGRTNCTDLGYCVRRKLNVPSGQRYELCSDKCRKVQALQNKREFDERARENNYDLLYKNECQNWRNKINRAKKTARFPAARLEEMRTAFEAFKKEALQRKRAVKEKTASPKEFTDWLYQQSNIIVELLNYCT